MKKRSGRSLPAKFYCPRFGFLDVNSSTIGGSHTSKKSPDRKRNGSCFARTGNGQQTMIHKIKSSLWLKHIEVTSDDSPNLCIFHHFIRVVQVPWNLWSLMACFPRYLKSCFVWDFGPGVKKWFVWIQTPSGMWHPLCSLETRRGENLGLVSARYPLLYEHKCGSHLRIIPHM